MYPARKLPATANDERHARYSFDMLCTRTSLIRRWRSASRLAFLAALCGAAGCDRSAASSAGAGPAAGDSEVRLGYFANLTHAQAVLAVESGELAEALRPARLKTQVFNAGPSLIEALFAGEIDIGYVGPSPALNAHAKSRGAGVRIIAGAAANGVAIVVRKDSGIENLAGLKGRRIATPQLGNTQDVSARHYLIHQLGQENADNVMAVSNAEQLPMMERGQIDAAWAPEPWAARLVIEAGGRLLAEEKDLWPGGEFTLALVITSPEFLSRRPDAVKAVLRVHRAWTKRLNAAPGDFTPQLAAALLKLTGKPLPAGALEQALQRTRFTDEPLAHTLETFAAWSYDLGLSRARPDLTGLVDTAILRSLSD
jgi:NitT/TauT family transport system substrate-binding protein